jgi:hypothetical protein
MAPGIENSELGIVKMQNAKQSPNGELGISPFKIQNSKFVL